MIIQKIIAIAGKPGLYEVLATNRNNLVVESMLDGKRSSLPGTSRVSSLGDITMYTTDEDLLLMEVLNRMHEHTGGNPGVSHKASTAEIRAFIDEIVPELDHERVFNSDLKKLVQWFNILVEKEAFPLVPEKSEEEPGDEGNQGTKEPRDEGDQGTKEPGDEGDQGSKEPRDEGDQGTKEPGDEGEKPAATPKTTAKKKTTPAAAKKKPAADKK